MVRVGDKVKFLDDVGGGVVKKISGSIVFVSGDDGFEIPVPIGNVIVLESGDSKILASKPLMGDSDERIAGDGAGIALGKEMSKETTWNYLTPFVNLGFVRKSLQGGHWWLDMYLLNNSEYKIVYQISKCFDNEALELKYNGVIEPGTKEYLDKFSLPDLDLKLNCQLLFFKEDGKFAFIKPFCGNVVLRPRSFREDKCFKPNLLLDAPATVIQLTSSDLQRQIEQLNVNIAPTAINPKVAPRAKGNHPPDKIIEVDLHIHQIVDNPSGLGKGEIFQIQMDRFHAVMEAQSGQKGIRIVFIHGVGNGILKREICMQLDKKYKKTYYQDASFKEYGYGATMVTIL